MKHGDKAKVKTAKASSKASVKKASKNGGSRPKSKDAKAEKAGGKSTKIVKTVKTGKSVEAAKGSGHEAVPAARPKAAVSNGRGAPDPGGFSNAAVAAAFKRAAKKYSNAFRRLTD